MIVLQLIDSLRAGGAERMAVAYANELSQRIEGSHLCVTRKEGILVKMITPAVGYLFLNKKATFDTKALIKLRKYIKEHRIDIIHAHTTSYFFAVLLKLSYPKIRIIWHEHQGNRVHMLKKNNRALHFSSRFFSAIFTVNEELTAWCRRNLKTKIVHYIPNFVQAQIQTKSIEERTDNIICVANLKPPKNHMNLLRAFKRVNQQFPEWVLVLVGRKCPGAYLDEMEAFISEHNLGTTVDVLGERADVLELMNEASIGVLSSDNEGLPVALLEYGASKLAVVTTNVGHCREVIKRYGHLVSPDNSDQLAEALLMYIADPEKRKKDALDFSQNIASEYSSDSVLPKIINFYKEILY